MEGANGNHSSDSGASPGRNPFDPANLLGSSPFAGALSPTAAGAYSHLSGIPSAFSMLGSHPLFPGGVLPFGGLGGLSSSLMAAAAVSGTGPGGLGYGLDPNTAGADWWRLASEQARQLAECSSSPYFPGVNGGFPNSLFGSLFSSPTASSAGGATPTSSSNPVFASPSTKSTPTSKTSSSKMSHKQKSPPPLDRTSTSQQSSSGSKDNRRESRSSRSQSFSSRSQRHSSSSMQQTSKGGKSDGLEPLVPPSSAANSSALLDYSLENSLLSAEAAMYSAASPFFFPFQLGSSAFGGSAEGATSAYPSSLFFPPPPPMASASIFSQPNTPFSMNHSAASGRGSLTPKSTESGYSGRSRSDGRSRTPVGHPSSASPAAPWNTYSGSVAGSSSAKKTGHDRRDGSVIVSRGSPGSSARTSGINDHRRSERSGGVDGRSSARGSNISATSYPGGDQKRKQKDDDPHRDRYTRPLYTPDNNLPSSSPRLKTLSRSAAISTPDETSYSEDGAIDLSIKKPRRDSPSNSHAATPQTPSSKSGCSTYRSSSKSPSTGGNSMSMQQSNALNALAQSQQAFAEAHMRQQMMAAGMTDPLSLSLAAALLPQMYDGLFYPSSALAAMAAASGAIAAGGSGSSSSFMDSTSGSGAGGGSNSAAGGMRSSGGAGTSSSSVKEDRRTTRGRGRRRGSGGSGLGVGGGGRGSEEGKRRRSGSSAFISSIIPTLGAEQKLSSEDEFNSDPRRVRGGQRVSSMSGGSGGTGGARGRGRGGRGRFMAMQMMYQEAEEQNEKHRLLMKQQQLQAELNLQQQQVHQQHLQHLKQLEDDRHSSSAGRRKDGDSDQQHRADKMGRSSRRETLSSKLQHHQSKLAQALMGGHAVGTAAADGSRLNRVGVEELRRRSQKLMDRSKYQSSSLDQSETDDDDGEGDTSNESSQLDGGSEEDDNRSMQGGSDTGHQASNLTYGGEKRRAASPDGGLKEPNRKRKCSVLDSMELRKPLTLGWQRETRIRSTEPLRLVGDVTYVTPCGRTLHNIDEIDKYFLESQEKVQAAISVAAPSNEQIPTVDSICTKDQIVSSPTNPTVEADPVPATDTSVETVSAADPVSSADPNTSDKIPSTDAPLSMFGSSTTTTPVTVGEPVLTRDNFSFSMRCIVGQFYEINSTAQSGEFSYVPLTSEDVMVKLAAIVACHKRRRAERRGLVDGKQTSDDQMSGTLSDARMSRKCEQMDLTKRGIDLKMRRLEERQQQKDDLMKARQQRAIELRKAKERQKVAKQEERVNRLQQVKVEREIRAQQMNEEKESKRLQGVMMREQSDSGSAWMSTRPPTSSSITSSSSSVTGKTDSSIAAGSFAKSQTTTTVTSSSSSFNQSQLSGGSNTDMHYYSYLLHAAHQRQQEQQLKQQQLKQQQLLKQQQQKEEQERHKLMLAVLGLERERRRQHVLLMKALECRKKEEEREKLKEERKIAKKIDRDKKADQKRVEMYIARELKKPLEDMCIYEGKELPNLDRVSGIRLAGKAFADCLMVLEFVHNFSSTLGFDTDSLPTMNLLQNGLLNIPGDTMDDFNSFIAHIVRVAIEDPGVANPRDSVTLCGQRLSDVEITENNISELMRIFIRSRNGHDDEMSSWLATRPFHSLNSTQKASVLRYFCNELLSSKNITSEIEKNIDTLNNLRRDKWVDEGKLRKLRMIQAKRFRRQVSKSQTIDDSNVTMTNGSAAATPSSVANGDKKRKLHDSDDDDNDDDNSSDSDALLNAADIGHDSETEEDQVMTSEELDAKIEKLVKQQNHVREKVSSLSHRLSAMSLGQDRFRRRYWILPKCGGVFVEGLESGEPESADPAGHPDELAKRASAVSNPQIVKNVLSTTPLSKQIKNSSSATTLDRVQSTVTNGHQTCESKLSNSMPAEKYVAMATAADDSKTIPCLEQTTKRRRGNEEHSVPVVKTADSLTNSIDRKVNNETEATISSNSLNGVSISQDNNLSSEILTTKTGGTVGGSTDASDIATTSGYSDMTECPVLNFEETNSICESSKISLPLEKLPKTDDVKLEMNTGTSVSAVDKTKNMNSISSIISDNREEKIKIKSEASEDVLNDLTSHVKSDPLAESQDLKIASHSNISVTDPLLLNDKLKLDSCTPGVEEVKINGVPPLDSKLISDGLLQNDTSKENCAPLDANMAARDNINRAIQQGVWFSVLPRGTCDSTDETCSKLSGDVIQPVKSCDVKECRPSFTLFEQLVAAAAIPPPQVTSVETLPEQSTGTQQDSLANTTPQSAILTADAPAWVGTSSDMVAKTSDGILPGLSLRMPLAVSASSASGSDPPAGPISITITLSNNTGVGHMNLRGDETLTQDMETCQVEYCQLPFVQEPIPLDKQCGWWRITSADRIKEFVSALNTCGVREKSLKHMLDRHLDYAIQSCSKNKKNILKLEATKESRAFSTGHILTCPPADDAKSWNHDLQRSIEIDLLEEIENMEEKVCHASLQGWKMSPRASTDESIHLVSSDHKDLAPTEQYIIEVARSKLLVLEHNVERRYLKPPLGRFHQLNLANMSTGSSSTKDNHHRTTATSAAAAATALANNVSDDDDDSDSDGDDEETATKELNSWRAAVKSAASAAQLSLYLDQLNRSIAWEKSIMKVSCQICVSDDNEAELLLCDICDKGYHTYCIREYLAAALPALKVTAASKKILATPCMLHFPIPPKLQAIPEGDWYCFECISKASNEVCCVVCGRLGARLTTCEFCKRRCHIDCMDPPLARLPKRWCCNACAAERGKLIRRRKINISSTPIKELESELSNSVDKDSNGLPDKEINSVDTKSETDTVCAGTPQSSPDNNALQLQLKSEPNNRQAAIKDRRNSYKDKSKSKSSVTDLQDLDSQSTMTSRSQPSDCVDDSRQAPPELSEEEESTVVKAKAKKSKHRHHRHHRHHHRHKDHKRRKRQVEEDEQQEEKAEQEKEEEEEEKEEEEEEEKDNGDKVDMSKTNGEAATEDDMSICKEILHEMRKHDDAWPFLAPVNAKQFPTYRKIILTPIDFETMSKKLRSNQYRTREEFASDARLVFNNCEQFNEDDSSVGRAGHSMHEFFNQCWAKRVLGKR